MQNPPDPRPVYEADQVLTVYDLIGIRNGYIYQLKRTPPWNEERRYLMKAGVIVCEEMLHWLHHGKPPKGVDPKQCKGDDNV